MDVKSLLTSPSPGYRMRGRGLYQLSGLAWSGHGRIGRVEVSADGGANWAEAALQTPAAAALPDALSRAVAMGRQRRGAEEPGDRRGRPRPAGTRGTGMLPGMLGPDAPIKRSTLSGSKSGSP